MKRWVLLFLWVSVCSICQVWTQPVASDSVFYIFIEKEEPEIVPEKPILKWEKIEVHYPQTNNKEVFQKEIQVLRLPLTHFRNRPLQNALYRADVFQDKKDKNAGHKTGFVSFLVDGLEKDKIVCLAPHNLSYKYDSLHFVKDMESAAQLSHDTLFTGLSDFGISESASLEATAKNVTTSNETLNQAIDLVIEKGFLASNSRPYFKIVFIRLVHHNEATNTDKVLTWIPYHLVKQLLEKSVWVQVRENLVLNAHEFLQTGEYECTVLR